MKMQIEKQACLSISVDHNDGMRTIDDVIRMLQDIRDMKDIPRTAKIRHIYITSSDQTKRMNKIEIEFKDITVNDIRSNKED